MRRGKSHRHKPSPCPDCGKMLDAAGEVSGGRGPKPGDAAVCFYCGHVVVFTDDMILRNPTDAELVELAGNSDMLEAQAFRRAAMVFRELVDKHKTEEPP